MLPRLRRPPAPQTKARKSGQSLARNNRERAQHIRRRCRKGGAPRTTGRLPAAVQESNTAKRPTSAKLEYVPAATRLDAATGGRRQSDTRAANDARRSR